MSKIEKIEKFEADPKKGHETHDLIREGRAIDIDPLRLAAVLDELRNKQNEIIEAINSLNNEK